MAAFPTPPTTPPVVPPPPPPRGRSALRRAAGPILLVAVLVAGGVAIAIGLDRPDGAGRLPGAGPGFEVPALDVAPGTAVPQVAAVAPGAVAEWANTLSEKTEIPARSLVAYAEAELAMRTATPGCNLSWATLAGVGRVESRHGRHGGARIDASGRLSPPIVGVPLDGSPGVRAIPDTDGGQLDGDAQWDRAVGAMQFLPTTWSRWGARAGGDGAAPDPQDIDDAALTAARFLCSRGGDLGTAAGWWRAVLAYNGSTAYGQNVFSGADAYARAAV